MVGNGDHACQQDVRALAETLIMVGISIEDLALTNHNFGDNGARNVIRLLQVLS